MLLGQLASSASSYLGSQTVPFPHALTAILITNQHTGLSANWPDVAYELRTTQDPATTAAVWTAARSIWPPQTGTSLTAGIMELFPGPLLHLRSLWIPLSDTPCRYIVRARNRAAAQVEANLFLTLQPLQPPD